MNIFCLPYSGGSSLMYSKLKVKLKNCINVIPVEYPGHGFRMAENLMTTMQDLVDDVYNQLIKKDNGDDFALLGYSLGSNIVYELYKKYKNTSLFKRLKYIVFSAMSLNSDVNNNVEVSEMDESEFMKYAINLGGSKFQTPADYENYKMFLPVIRQDLMIYFDYKKYFDPGEDEPIDKNVYIFYSDDEKNIHDYDSHCSRKICYKWLDGGHFFINSHLDIFVNELEKINNQYVLSIV